MIKYSHMSTGDNVFLSASVLSSITGDGQCFVN